MRKTGNGVSGFYRRGGGLSPPDSVRYEKRTAACDEPFGPELTAEGLSRVEPKNVECRISKGGIAPLSLFYKVGAADYS
jgi:hypothetical protein